MANPTSILEQDLTVLDSTWSSALPAFAASSEDLQSDLESMSASGLMDVATSIAKARRDLDAVHSRVAFEIARRSAPEAGPDGFARRQGFGTPARLVAATTGGTNAEANRLISVGSATAHRTTLTGEILPAPHPHIAQAVADGTLSLDAAAQISAMLDRVAPRASVDDLLSTEATLVHQATSPNLSLSLDHLTRLIKHAEAYLDPNGVEPREDDLRDDRTLSIREDSSGMVHLTGHFDPETAAPILAALRGMVTAALQNRAEVEPQFADPRTLGQIRADALSSFARHVLGCTETSLPLTSTTVVVRMTLETLMDGLGHAEIAGIDQPISATTARRMAASAGIIPVVLGGAGEVLDVGRARRLFTPSQRLALSERDGGCACCGAPPGYAEAHHIDWWKRDVGPTNLSNGVMLDPACHHRMHRDGWTIDVIDGQVWFTPPVDVDPQRRPRLGGRARYDYTPDVA